MAKPRPGQRTPAPAAGARAATARRRATSIHALVERNYATLRRIASREIRSANMARTITPTSLVAEMVMRLMKQRNAPSTDPHLCGLSTVLMTQALSDRIKMRRARKRGGGARPLALDPELSVDRRRGDTARTSPGRIRFSVERGELLAHMAELSRTHPRMVEIVTLHVVLDLPMEQVATMLGISVRTGYRELECGRKALARSLGFAAP